MEIKEKDTSASKDNKNSSFFNRNLIKNNIVSFNKIKQDTSFNNYSKPKTLKNIIRRNNKSEFEVSDSNIILPEINKLNTSIENLVPQIKNKLNTVQPLKKIVKVFPSKLGVLSKTGIKLLNPINKVLFNKYKTNNQLLKENKSMYDSYPTVNTEYIETETNNDSQNNNYSNLSYKPITNNKLKKISLNKSSFVSEEDLFKSESFKFLWDNNNEKRIGVQSKNVFRNYDPNRTNQSRFSFEQTFMQKSTNSIKQIFKDKIIKKFEDMKNNGKKPSQSSLTNNNLFSRVNSRKLIGQSNFSFELNPSQCRLNTEIKPSNKSNLQESFSIGSANKLDDKKNNLEVYCENGISLFKSQKPNGLKRDSFLHSPNKNSSSNIVNDQYTKSITFNKQIINNLNNLLIDTKEVSTLTGVNTKEDTMTFPSNMDCIEDLHFEFVKFSIRSKKLIRYQENAMRTCMDDFSTVVAMDEVELE